MKLNLQLLEFRLSNNCFRLIKSKFFKNSFANLTYKNDIRYNYNNVKQNLFSEQKSSFNFHKKNFNFENNKNNIHQIHRFFSTKHNDAIKNITNNKLNKNSNSTETITNKELEVIRNKKLSEKLDSIFKNEFNEKINYQKETEFILNKLKSFNAIYGLLRYPIYIIIVPLSWMNPFSSIYSITLIATNYYIIFLTLIESSIFFSAGLTYYLINTNNYSVKNNLLTIRDTRNFKRMSVSFLHFSFILMSAILANNYSNQYSLILLLLGNAYLYAKYSYHIFLKIFPKDLFQERMMMIFYNVLLCIGLLIIISWKKYLHTMIA